MADRITTVGFSNVGNDKLMANLKANLDASNAKLNANIGAMQATLNASNAKAHAKLEAALNPRSTPAGSADGGTPRSRRNGLKPRPRPTGIRALFSRAVEILLTGRLTRVGKRSADRAATRPPVEG